MGGRLGEQIDDVGHAAFGTAQTGGAGDIGLVSGF